MILQPFGHHYRGNKNKAFFFTMLIVRSRSAFHRIEYPKLRNVWCRYMRRAVQMVFLRTTFSICDFSLSLFPP